MKIFAYAGLILGLPLAHGQTALGDMTINGVQTKVTHYLLSSTPEQAVQTKVDAWRQQGLPVIRSSADGWVVASAMVAGEVQQVQARQRRGVNQTEMIFSTTPLKSIAKPNAAVPAWLNAMVDQGFQIVSSTESIDQFMRGSSWLLRAPASSQSNQNQALAIKIFSQNGYQEHPASRLTGSQAQKHFSASSGHQLSFEMTESNGQALALITHFANVKYEK